MCDREAAIRNAGHSESAVARGWNRVANERSAARWPVNGPGAVARGERRRDGEEGTEGKQGNEDGGPRGHEGGAAGWTETAAQRPAMALASR